MNRAVACLFGCRRAALLGLLLLVACGGGGGADSPTDSPGDVVVVDFDGDGRDDLAATTARITGPPPHPGVVKVWLQRAEAPGDFLPAVTYAVGPDPWQLRSGDIDGDGIADLVAMSSHASAVEDAPLVDVVTVLRGDPARLGRFLPGVVLYSGARLSDIAIADFAADGSDDIAFTGYGIDARVGVWWSDAGSFSAAETVVAGSAGALAAADLDGDASPDLAWVAGDEVWVARRDAATAHGFRTPVRAGGGENLSCLAAVDLDADGRTDLVLGSRETLDFGAPGDLLTLRNASNEADPVRFDFLQEMALDVHAFECVAADMDGDARADLVTTGAGVAGQLFDDIVEVILAVPGEPGRLANAVTTVTRGTSSGYHLAVGNLSADDRPDVAMPYGGGVLIWLQDPARPGALLRGPALS